MLPAFLIVVISVVSLCAGTAAVAVRIASRTRLIEALKRAGREGGLEHLERFEREFELSATALRMLSALMFVLVVSATIEPGSRWYIQPIVVFLLSAVWLLVVAGAIPVAWARYAGESFIARTLPLMDVARRLNAPALFVVRVIDEIVRRLAGAPPEAADRAEQMEREILDAVSEAETVGAVDTNERNMIRSVMDMDERTVGEILTPRTEMQGIEVGADYQRARRLVVEAGRSRMPVFEETLDKIVGVLYAKDLLNVEDVAGYSTRELMRKVVFVPETKDVHSLLREFQANRVHIAIVVDEYGGTAGLVTIEDILEELVGEITDEHDEDPVAPLVSRVDETTTEIDARLRVDEVNNKLGISLPIEEAYDTIGGFVYSRMGRIPAAGEGFVEDDIRVEVVDVDERRIKRLRICRVEAAREE
ncbi:MAG: hemolysin family protein [Planctomycetota bacterium]|nr:hemolysin family protein [Planctomycetota bacterium]